MVEKILELRRYIATVGDGVIWIGDDLYDVGGSDDPIHPGLFHGFEGKTVEIIIKVVEPELEQSVGKFRRVKLDPLRSEYIYY